MMKANQKRLYEMKAEIIQAVAHPIRLAVIEYLGEGEKCVCDIVEHVDAQRSNGSRHLALMLKAGVLECRKEGLKVFYRIKTPCILGFLGCVEKALRERVEGDAALLKAMK
ncbi:ArsR/SmtB family transcription factor [Planctomycetota bacterium]